MSHYSVCVILPAESIAKNHGICGALDRALEPFEECPSGKQFLVFCDKQEDVEKEFNEGEGKAVRFPDGHIASIYSEEFSEKYLESDGEIYEYTADKHDRMQSEESRKMQLIPNCKNKDAFESLEKFCTDFLGYTKNAEGHWGYFHNPNAKWDWYEVGGRFANSLLVHKDAEETIAHNVVSNRAQNELLKDFPSLQREEPRQIDGEYYLVDFALKGEIAWKKIRENEIAVTKASYERYTKWLENGKVEPEKSLIRITEEGLVSWSGLVMKRGESYEEFCKRIGFDSEAEYSLSPYSILDREGKWHSLGEMGWWGISTQEQNACDWNHEIQQVLRDTKDTDMLVYVDCHI